MTDSEIVFHAAQALAGGDDSAADWDLVAPAVDRILAAGDVPPDQAPVIALACLGLDSHVGYDPGLASVSAYRLEAILPALGSVDALAAPVAATLSNRLSGLGNRQRAFTYAAQAESLYRVLAETQPEAFLPDLASSSNNLGIRLSELGRREDALKPSQEAVDLYRVLAETQPEAFLPDLAMSLNNLGVMLSGLGRREDALKPSQEAVDIRRVLAETQPEAFLPDLAASLNNLGIRLSELGRREDALKPSQEAVDLYRVLAETQPEAFLPDLAASLNNLGAILSELGRREDALKPSQEAVDIRRVLAETQPEAFLPDLAASLNNLGAILSGLGRREDALKPSQEAVDIRRVLAETQPEAFLPDLAASLNNLGARLSGLGRREDALKPSQEAVDLYRVLAETQPEAFLPDLAASLNNLGARLSELGRREDALKPSQEAVDLYRVLAETQPEAFLPDLAMSLNNLGIRLSELGRREDALKPSQEAVDLYRVLAETQPEAFLPDLAMSLNNLGAILSELGRREDALKPSQEAVDIRRVLAETQPEAFLPDLAASLNNLGIRLSGLGRREDALKPSQEAVDIRRVLAETQPEAFLPDLAASLNNLGARLSGLGRREDALKPSQEAVDLYRVLAETQPEAFLPDLAASLNNLGARLSELGRREDALKPSQEAVDLYRVLAETQPEAFLPDLAMSLNNLGVMLSGLGRREDALKPSQEAVDLYRVLAETQPEAFLPDLAASLNNLGIRLSELGRREDALKPSQEAVDIRRVLAETQPEAFLPNLAASLNNLGTRLSELGRREDALKPSQEAVDLYRVLAETQPEAFLPNLAASLNNLGTRLSELGRREDALVARIEVLGLDGAGFSASTTAMRAVLDDGLVAGGSAADLATVERRLVALPADLEVERFAVSSRSDRAWMSRGLAWTSSLGGVFLAESQQRPGEALRWLAATTSLEIGLLGSLRSAELAQLEVGHSEMAKRLTQAVEVQSRDGAGVEAARPDDASGRPPEAPRAVLKEIRELPGFEAFLQPPTVADVIASCRAQATAVIVFGKERGTIIVVGEDGVVYSRPLPIGMNQLLEELIRAEGSGTQAAIGRYRLANIVRDMIVPLLASVGSSVPLRVVPVGVAGVLPIQSVMATEGMDVRIGHTIGLLDASSASGRGEPVVVHSDPVLTFGMGEAAYAAELAGTPLITDPAATPAAVLERLGGNSLAYFSCHGSADFTDPDNSGLMLFGVLAEEWKKLTLAAHHAKDTPQEGATQAAKKELIDDNREQVLLSVRALNDVMARRGPPAFAGLSACHSSRAGLTSPEQAQSIASVFLAHGTRAVLGTHWAVGDAAACEFGTMFLTKWKAGLTAGEAYQETLLTLWDSNGPRNVLALDSLFAFCLYGDRSMLWPLPSNDQETSSRTLEQLEPALAMARNWSVMNDNTTQTDNEFAELLAALVPNLPPGDEPLLPLYQAWVAGPLGSDERDQARVRLSVAVGIPETEASRALGAAAGDSGAKQERGKPVGEQLAADLEAVLAAKDDKTKNQRNR